MVGVTGSKGVPRAEREEQILEIAAAELGRRGYAHASMDLIAERAGISKPLIYSYFGSKDGLAVACLHRAGGALARNVAEAQHGPALGRALQTLDAIFRTLEDRRYYWSVLFDATIPPQGEVYETARRYRRRLNELGAEGVRELLGRPRGRRARDAELLTHLWLNGVSATVSWWSEHPDETAASMRARLTRILQAMT